MSRESDTTDLSAKRRLQIMADQNQTTTVEAGALVRPYLRDILEQMTFEVPGSRYKESKGFLSSKFFIKAPPHALKVIARWIDRVNEDE